MKIGLVMGSCSEHEFAYTARYLARKNSEESTNRVAIFQGFLPVLSQRQGFEACVVNRACGQEQGVWRIAFQYAIERCWDWCVIIHDDFYILEPAWEERLRSAPRRIGIAGWWVYRQWAMFSATSNLASAETPELGVALDSCGIAFNMHYFSKRGAFTTLNVECGFGDLEASGWCLEQRLGVWSMGLRSDRGCGGSRAITKTPADGFDYVMKQYRGVLPAFVVNEDSISTGSSMFSMLDDLP